MELKTRSYQDTRKGKRRAAQCSSLYTRLNGFHGQISYVRRTELKRQSQKCSQGGRYS